MLGTRFSMNGRELLEGLGLVVKSIDRKEETLVETIWLHVVSMAGSIKARRSSKLPNEGWLEVLPIETI